MSTEVQDSFKRARINEFIDKMPETRADVMFGEKTVTMARTLPVVDVRACPEVHWPDLDSEALHLVMLVDLDAPSKQRNTANHFVHWLVVNVPGEEIVRGDTIAAYQPPSPPAKTGSHRYVLFVWKLRNKVDAAKLKPFFASSRANFDMKKFQKSVTSMSSMELLAGNLFYCKAAA